MIYFKDNKGDITFVAHGPGVKVPIPLNANMEPETYRKLREDWLAKRDWCTEQGWAMNIDFFLPGHMTNATWFFNTPEKQMLFVMRWS